MVCLARISTRYTTLFGGSRVNKELVDLEQVEQRSLVHAQWRYADGLVPGEPNGGLVNELTESPAR